MSGRPIRLFNHGRHSRDFTYVEDVAEGVIRAADRVAAPDPAWDPARPDPGTSSAPFRIYNIGNSRPVELLDFIAALERELGRRAVTEPLPAQPGDVADTFADTARLEAATGWRPETPVAEGVRKFVAWFRAYHSPSGPEIPEWADSRSDSMTCIASRPAKAVLTGALMSISSPAKPPSGCWYRSSASSTS